MALSDLFVRGIFVYLLTFVIHYMKALNHSSEQALAAGDTYDAISF